MLLPMTQTQKFCTSCASPLSIQLPRGDNRERHVCNECGEIHYQNPKIITGCIPEWQDRVLLCRRAIEPRHGFWTLPAGFMENGESAQQGAARETMEEANARVRIVQLYATFNLPHIDQVYLLFRGQLLDTGFSPGEESLETCLYKESEIPWDDLAFSVVHATLVHYFADRERGEFVHRVGDIQRIPGAGREYQVEML